MSDNNPTIKPFLIINYNQVFYLDKEEIAIGRSEENDLVINKPSISRKHAQISSMNDRYLIKDLNSSAGTYVNGRPIVHKLLEPGDKITLAIDLEMAFGVDIAELSEDIEIYDPEGISGTDIATSSLDEDTLQEPSDEG
ncbi:MAG: FHA domain-containing protein [Anaerolineae bacterium]|nr:FHA domain-containing protein [Anaerolineae bacterium]